ncbi:hypothetical protein MIMGU_mgv11b017474mg [Erythranthe guttata]|uniref:Disease resistance protein winged helix domain-containing protein n=1 Tax=Erythranthe guttata TaxID=4155 RepID=A0A022R7Q4_ERYGU|nr:hypothetical protein MIMGU_mgv11b017474mg [Erythranthe guttata]
MGVLGVFPEDKNIRVSWLVKVWVCEGFLKSISGKSLEAAAREYLEDLCDRNLILVHQRGLNGGIKFCKIHDLVRELCLREAEKEKINTRRRISIHQSASEKEYLPQARHALECMPLARSLIVGRQGVLPVLNAVDKYLNDHVFSLEAVFQLVNSRFIAITSDRDQNADFPSSINLLWNLQTLIVKERDAFAPFEIWKMTQLRHVQFNQLEMPDPPLDGKDEYVLGNLRTDLERWTTESAHFPRLEQLDLRHLDRLEEIPSDIGEIPTLQSIRVQYCSKTAVISELLKEYWMNKKNLTTIIIIIGASWNGNSNFRLFRSEKFQFWNNIFLFRLPKSRFFWIEIRIIYKNIGISNFRSDLISKSNSEKIRFFSEKYAYK